MDDSKKKISSSIDKKDLPIEILLALPYGKAYRLGLCNNKDEKEEEYKKENNK